MSNGGQPHISHPHPHLQVDAYARSTEIPGDGKTTLTMTSCPLCGNRKRRPGHQSDVGGMDIRTIHACIRIQVSSMLVKTALSLQVRMRLRWWPSIHTSTTHAGAIMVTVARPPPTSHPTNLDHPGRATSGRHEEFLVLTCRRCRNSTLVVTPTIGPISS
jgi:predicted nucleic-acid-binding Zn-ribbon protein